MKYILFICLLAIAATVACRDLSIPGDCRKKISARLLQELTDDGSKREKYRVVVRLTDSSGIREIVPSISIANNVIATGFLTSDEIKKICVVENVEFIDLEKQYYPRH